MEEPRARPALEPAEGSGVTLAGLLGVAEFRLACVTGEEGLGREVRWAHPTELLDPSQYLRGGELVCTVGTSLVDDAACARFAAAVDSAGASGICFGVGDVHEEVPEALVTACRERGLPLLVAPFGVPFVSLGEYLAQTRVAAQSAAGERGGRLLVELLSRVRVQASTAELLDLVAEQLGGRWELGEGDRRLESGGRAAPAGDVSTATAESPDGTTLTWTGSGTAPSATLLETLARVLGVARHERDVEQDLRRERTGQLLSLVADRLASPSSLSDSLSGAGLPTDALVFSVWPPGASRVLASAVSDVPLVLGETPSATVAITLSADTVRATADRLGIACGLSRPVPLGESARGLGEARAAFAIARRGGGGCVGPEGLTSLDGLLVQQPPDRLRPFVDQLLRPLLSSDANRRTSYVRTLGTFLRCDGSLTATAREEFLHVNTVRHRLERVRELTGRDPLVFDDRVALAIALWAYENLGS